MILTSCSAGDPNSTTVYEISYTVYQYVASNDKFRSQHPGQAYNKTDLETSSSVERIR